jgi:hypothetical protein
MAPKTDNYKSAADDVNAGLSIRNASKKWNVSRSALHRRVTGRIEMHRTVGKHTTLTAAEETYFAGYALEMSQRGFGLTVTDFREAVGDFVKKDKRRTPFRNDVPGDKFWRGYRKRNPEVKRLRTKLLPRNRAAVSPKDLESWFMDYEQFLASTALINKPSNVWNCDESGFSLSGKEGYVIGPANSKIPPPQITGTDSKQNITVLACCNASGVALPPFIVYPGKRQGTTNLLAGGIGNEGATMTESGWMTADAFLTWLSQHFIPNLPPTRPQVLLIDSAGPHIDYRTFRHAKDNGVEIYRLPRNSTHLLQPLDNGVFGTLKSEWYSAVRDFVRRFPAKKVTKETFCSVFRQAWVKGVTQQGIITSFKRTGIFPVDRKVITNFNLKPSITFQPHPTASVPVAPLSATAPSHASTALEVFETCLNSPVLRVYNTRLEEDYDLDTSPRYKTWVALRDLTSHDTATTPAEEPLPAIEAAHEVAGISPILVDTLQLPIASTSKAAIVRTKLAQELPDYLTSEISMRMCEEQQIKKMKEFALKQKRLRKKEQKEKEPVLSGKRCSKASKSKSSSSTSGPSSVHPAVDLDACRFCGGLEINDAPETSWVFCDRCECWMHVRCLPGPLNITDLEEQDEFICC